MILTVQWTAAACVKAPEKRSSLRTNTEAATQDDGGVEGDVADAEGAGDVTDAGDGTDTGDEWLDGIEANGDLTYLNFAKDVLDAHCVSCHGEDPIAGAPLNFRLTVFEDEGGMRGVSSMLERIVARVGDSTMPPASQTALPETDREKLAAWFKGGGKKGTAPAAALDPAGELTAPASLHMSATNSEFQVATVFTDVSAEATWDLYYTTVSGAVSGGTLLIADLPITTTGYDWLMMALPDGEYFVYGLLHEGSKTIAFSSPGSVDWDNPSDNNAPPTITLTGPWTGTNNASRAVVLPADITYTITDADVGDTHTVKVEYRVGGGAWQTLTLAHTNATQYRWDDTASPMAERLDYEVRLTVTDGTASDVDASAAVFGIADAAYDFSDTVPILANCIGGGCHGPGVRDWTVYGTVLPKVDVMITRAIDGTEMRQESGGSQGAPLGDDDKRVFKLWRWLGALE